MNAPWIALVSVLCNVGAQLAMKYGGQVPSASDALAPWRSPWLLGAVMLYGLSFLLTVKVVAVNPLSVASPAMAGSTFFLVTLMSWLLLGESMGLQKLAGITLIVGGIVLLSRT